MGFVGGIGNFDPDEGGGLSMARWLATDSFWDRVLTFSLGGGRRQYIFHLDTLIHSTHGGHENLVLVFFFSFFRDVSLLGRLARGWLLVCFVCEFWIHSFQPSSLMG
jgi:hypothetical protein